MPDVYACVYGVTPHPYGSRLDEAAPDGVARELDAVAHAELLEHVRAVTLDGLLTDHEGLGDLPVVVSLGDQLDHLQLARGEGIGVVLGRLDWLVAGVSKRRPGSPAVTSPPTSRVGTA
jgi:hypothetical protein